ncbi:MAG: M20/M25/M40 family metallo-hydrolase [Geodermatophilaceae bacterium]|nr:M20/M25/M40 family metallo-hydrolase [Geodermatophilaceae bacterium]
MGVSPVRSSGAVRLLEDLVRISSAGANEGTVNRHCALMLNAVNARTRFVNWAPNREQLVARFDGAGPPLTLTGHVDTVPADRSAWSVDPWAAESDGIRIVGRGTSDMKSGIAAMVTAVVGHLRRPHACRGIQLVLTAAEETGCQGALQLPSSVLGQGGPLLVGEPTANALVAAHKGALWLRLTARGRAAHGSAPELGDNAVVRLARAATALHDASAWPSDERFGQVTANVGRFCGGVQPNVVPDSAELHLDLRTVPGVDPIDLRKHVKGIVGEDISVSDLVDLPLVDTDLDDPFVGLVREALAVNGLPDEPSPPARFFTDASALIGLLGKGSGKRPAPVPTVILGPGEPDQCHVVDEWCRADRVEQAVAVYASILASWCDGAGGPTAQA